jgi:hypothetical protein
MGILDQRQRELQDGIPWARIYANPLQELLMSGYVTIACRLNDDTKYVTDRAHSRNAHDIYTEDASFLDGDDSGARKYLAWHREMATDLSIVPIRENEYGVLLIDFVRKVISLNRDDWDIRSQRYFSPEDCVHDRDMGNAGRVTLVCPENSVEPLKITPEMLSDWKSRVESGPRGLYGHQLRDVPFPSMYFVRNPQPSFIFDYSPWTIRHFHEKQGRRGFWKELEAGGFTVDRKGWMSRFK